MDFHDLQKKLFDIEPTNPAEDKAKMIAALNSSSSQPAPEIPQTVSESYNVAEGSLQLDKDYSVNDFAALAGVTTAQPNRVVETITDQDYRPIPSTFEDKDTRIAQLEERVAKLEKMLQEERTDEILPAVAAVAGRAVAGAVVNKLTANKKNKKPTHKMPDGTVMKGKSHKKPFVKDKAQKESFIKDELYRKLKEYEYKSK